MSDDIIDAVSEYVALLDGYSVSWITVQNQRKVGFDDSKGK